MADLDLYFREMDIFVSISLLLLSPKIDLTVIL